MIADTLKLYIWDSTACHIDIQVFVVLAETDEQAMQFADEAGIMGRFDTVVPITEPCIVLHYEDSHEGRWGDDL